LIKQTLTNRAGQGIELLINKAGNRREAEDVFARVDRSCRRFLGFGVRLAGHLAAGSSGAEFSGIAARLCERRAPLAERKAA
jgi:hypothetical protein